MLEDEEIILFVLEDEESFGRNADFGCNEAGRRIFLILKTADIPGSDPEDRCHSASTHILTYTARERVVSL